MWNENYGKRFLSLYAAKGDRMYRIGTYQTLDAACDKAANVSYEAKGRGYDCLEIVVENRGVGPSEDWRTMANPIPRKSGSIKTTPDGLTRKCPEQTAYMDKRAKRLAQHRPGDDGRY